jgi:hypothetical protein
MKPDPIQIQRDAELWEAFMMEMEFATFTLEDGTIIDSTNNYTYDQLRNN